MTVGSHRLRWVVAVPLSSLVALFTLAELSDLVTAQMVRHELNPIAASLSATPLLSFALKVALIAFVVATAVICERERPGARPPGPRHRDDRGRGGRPQQHAPDADLGPARGLVRDPASGAAASRLDRPARLSVERGRRRMHPATTRGRAVPSSHRRLRAAATLVLLAALSGAVLAVPIAAATSSVTGSITYREPIALSAAGGRDRHHHRHDGRTRRRRGHRPAADRCADRPSRSTSRSSSTRARSTRPTPTPCSRPSSTGRAPGRMRPASRSSPAARRAGSR